MALHPVHGRVHPDTHDDICIRDDPQQAFSLGLEGGKAAPLSPVLRFFQRFAGAQPVGIGKNEENADACLAQTTEVFLVLDARGHSHQ